MSEVPLYPCTVDLRARRCFVLDQVPLRLFRQPRTLLQTVWAVRLQGYLAYKKPPPRRTIQ